MAMWSILCPIAVYSDQSQKSRQLLKWIGEKTYLKGETLYHKKRYKHKQLITVDSRKQKMVQRKMHIRDSELHRSLPTAVTWKESDAEIRRMFINRENWFEQIVVSLSQWFTQLMLALFLLGFEKNI